MSDAERTPGSSSPGPGTPTGPPPGSEGPTGRAASTGGASAGEYTGEYTGPGAWGTAAMWLLGTLFVLSAAATVHSILATFGG
jgi:hypothetical protein